MYKDNFDELYKEFTPLIYSIVKRIYVDNMLKEDLIQECAMVLNKCNNDFKEGAKTKFSTYFYTSAKNRMYELIRNSNRDKRPEMVSYELLINEIANPVEEEDENEWMLERIIRELENLPRGEITMMIYIEGMTMEDVAKIENISKQRVQFLNKRNLNKLKEIFD